MMTRLLFAVLGLVAAEERSPVRMALGVLFGSAVRPDRPAPQPMKVIGAGMGRKGTSSLVLALRRLGLNPYHMKDGVVETADHLQLFHAAAVASRGVLPVPSAEALAIIDRMAADGFNATTDFPACLLHAELLARYPAARVVLTRRRNGEAWADSVLRTIGAVSPVLEDVPFRWVAKFRMFSALNTFIWSAIGAPVDASLMPRRDELAAAHDAWLARVAAAVPADQLLVHQPTDGWAPLCAFLAPADPAIERACGEVLAAGEPYPWVNEGAEIERGLVVFQCISLLFKAICLWLLFYVLPSAALRSQRQATAASGARTRRGARSQKRD
jgi:hypothetical protein